MFYTSQFKTFVLKKKIRKRKVQSQTGENIC